MIRRKTLVSALLGTTLAVSPALLGAERSLAQSDTSEEKTAEELALEGVDNLMRALELMIENIPQYEMPEINERGDIIIRRKNPPQSAPEDSPDAPSDQTPDETET